ncbi:MAG: nicotinate-nucleotide--dimethylbenzimidazole phosphoribosyltransferase [Peptococcaceae bacterium]|nr:nicotinate-nucleotide--dimethylbenzimidazole phosphoribosyltransferase [Peptococcaceae bacterium]
MLLSETISRINEVDQGVMLKTKSRLDSLIKPPGSLGSLEEIAIKLSGIQNRVLPVYGKSSVILMAGDHGVVEEGVSAAPKEITLQMLSAFASGVAGINVISKLNDTELVVVDVGVDSPVKIKGVIDCKIRMGTGNITKGPAMTRQEAIEAIETGIVIVNSQIDKGYSIIATGDMGIGNTTPSSAILSVLAGLDAELATGRGTMVNNMVLEKKIWAVREAIRVNVPDPKDGIDVLSKVGGLEIAGLVGVILGSAARRVPVVIDGFISSAAAMIAASITEKSKAYIIPSHLSGESGHDFMLKHLGLKPLLHLDMRLGEGTGAVLAMRIIEAACRLTSDMASFQEAGLSDLDEDKLNI